MAIEISFFILVVISAVGIAQYNHGGSSYPTPPYAAAPSTYAAPGTGNSQSPNILRSYGNPSQGSPYSKTGDPQYSSIGKSDVRTASPSYRSYSNPAYSAPAYSAGAPVSAQIYPGQPAYSSGPSYSSNSAPTYASPTSAYSGSTPSIYPGQSTSTYSGTSGTYQSQSGAYSPQSGAYSPQSGAYSPQQGSYSSQSGAYSPQRGSYSPQSGAYSQQSAAYASQPAAYSAKGGPGNARIGVAYSAAPAVSHMSFDGYGVKYDY